MTIKLNVPVTFRVLKQFLAALRPTGSVLVSGHIVSFNKKFELARIIVSVEDEDLVDCSRQNGFELLTSLSKIRRFAVMEAVTYCLQDLYPTAKHFSLELSAGTIKHRKENQQVVRYNGEWPAPIGL